MTDDLRKSLEEPYGNRARFVAAVELAADTFVRGRFLHPEDAARYIQAATDTDIAGSEP